MVKIGDKSLIQHSAEVALAITEKVIVVTGAYANEVSEELIGFPVRLVYNHQYESGIASSICSGVCELINYHPQIENIILLVCDQPHISVNFLQQLIDKRQETKKPIVACAYQQTIGTPALFHKNYFPSLLELKADVGAKKIMQKHPEDVATIDFPLGFIDIDTEEDFNNLQK